MASKRDQIVTGLATVLAGITKANGYNTDLATAGGTQRVSLRQNLRDLPTVIVGIDGEGKSEGNSEDVACRLRVDLTAVPDPTSTADIGDAIDDLVEDVERALLPQDDAEPRLGVQGVMRVEIAGHDNEATVDDGIVFARIRLVVTYHHDPHDPATWRGVA